ncbi:DUF2220 family protein [Citricoccus nitrophenolicus]
MVSLEEARSEARRRLVAAHRQWTLYGWSSPVWALPLHPPTERQVLDNPVASEAWVRHWASHAWPEGMNVQWEDRTWRSVGTQRIPVRLVAQTPDALARWVGGQEARNRTLFATRATRIRALTNIASDSLSPVLRRYADRLTSLPEADFDRLLGITDWLGTHRVAGLRPRQLPIRGVDSKWFSAHRTVLTALHGALYATQRSGKEGDPIEADEASPPSGAAEAERGTVAPGDAVGVGLGIVDADPRIRMRVLDPELRPAGLEDLQVPVAQARALPWRPECVLIVENLETLLCLPDARGVVAMWGRGFDTAAVTMPWLADLPIIYWGDLDSHGFAILYRYRVHLPQIESVLMDESTLEAFEDLWVSEPQPSRGQPASLTAAESRTLGRLRLEGDVRLEQERVPWTYALERLIPSLSFSPSAPDVRITGAPPTASDASR